MRAVFIDSDVIMDFLTKREPFVIESMKLMEYGYRKAIKVHISSLSLSNIYYLIGKQLNKEMAREQIKAILGLVEVLSVHKSTLEKAAYSQFKDFEDAIQHFCAEENGIKVLITRNVKDYVKSNLSIQTPMEFLSNFEGKS